MALIFYGLPSVMCAAPQQKEILLHLQHLLLFQDTTVLRKAAVLWRQSVYLSWWNLNSPSKEHEAPREGKSPLGLLWNDSIGQKLIGI